LDKHPAIRAWQRIDGPQDWRVEPLKEHEKSQVYRLTRRDGSGPRVVAKRTASEVVQIEQAIYGQLLPRAGLPAPRYLGHGPDVGAFAWLFIEDVGDNRYRKTSTAHRAAATAWLAAMHVSMADVAPARGLPARGAGYYESVIVEADAVLASSTTSEFLRDEQRTAIDAVRRLLDSCRAHIEDMADLCASVPSTLVHGDFMPKNVRVSQSATGLVVRPFDWELSGWGSPAVDIMRTDLERYQSEVSTAWPDVSLERVRQMHACGLVFRSAQSVVWQRHALGTPWVGRAIADKSAKRALDRVPAALNTLGWAGL
jgi:hypothetical protein